MKRRLLLIPVLIAALALAVVTAGPAFAADMGTVSCNTTVLAADDNVQVEFEITHGDFTRTVSFTMQMTNNAGVFDILCNAGKIGTFSEKLGVPLPVTSLIQQMICSLNGDADHSAIAIFLEDMAGITISGQ